MVFWQIQYILLYGRFRKSWVFPQIIILIGFSIINHPFWGTTIFRNTHIVYWVGPLPSHHQFFYFLVGDPKLNRLGYYHNHNHDHHQQQQDQQQQNHHNHKHNLNNHNLNNHNHNHSNLSHLRFMVVICGFCLRTLSLVSTWLPLEGRSWAIQRQ